MTAYASVLLISAVILAIIFGFIFAIGRKFKSENAGFGKAMMIVGVIGAVVCVIAGVVVAML
jgi:FtsH-binding integral membrane protein